MNPKYTRPILIGGILVAILQSVCYAHLKDHTMRPAWLTSALDGAFLLANVLIVLSLYDFAKTKRRRSFLGLVLGFAGCWGLLVCAWLPDLTPQEQDEPGSQDHQLKGLITDPDGKPDPGAQLAIFPSFTELHWIKAGHGGKYRLAWSVELWQAQDGGRRLIARDPARSLATVEECPKDMTNLDIILKPALTLTGQVKDASGAPMPGVQVEFQIKAGSGYVFLDDHTRPTDTQGRYEFKCLPADGQYMVYVSAKGYGSSERFVENDSETNRLELSPLVLKLVNEVIAGQVLKDDQPVAGVNVNLSGEGQPAGRVATDGQGRFHFQVCAGQIRLWAFSPSGGGNAQATVEAGDTNIVMTLPTWPGNRPAQTKK